MSSQNDILNMLSGQHSQALKKYVYELIKDRYPQHEEILSRVTPSLVTKHDVEKFARLIADIYESGFMRATDQYKETMNQLGYELKIVPPKNKEEAQKIFKD